MAATTSLRPAMDLREQLQTTLGDAYQLERELGGGGMARVFVANEVAFGRRVVVKVLQLETGGVVSLDRFRREVALAAQLQHPHIVPMLSAGETGGLAYYLMPYIQGESLRARLAKEGELPVSVAARILREVASALAFAHQAGVVHRDIKPDNVLLASGAAMVTDFGIAKALSASSTATGDSLTTFGIALGTPAYMAPEQASADPLVDHRADIYAWGVLAYELLTGTTPFSGRSPQAVLAAHVSENVDPISNRRPQLPPALGQLVMRCLEKRAADRPQSAEELVHALDELSTPSGGLQATSAVRSTPPGLRLGTRRRTLFLGVAAVAVASAIAVATWNGAATRAISRVSGGAGAAGVPDPKRLAVLPFDNIPPDSTTEYIAQGLRDEIADALTRVPGFRVVERTSSIASRKLGVGATEVGQLLHSGTLIQGSVRRTGGRLRVQVEIIDARDGLTLWGHSFENALDDGFAIQIGIGQAIADSLRARFAGGAQVTAVAGTANPVAHDHYLQGVFYLRKYTEPSIRKAMTLFRQASAADVRYAAPWAGMARAWGYLADDWLAPRDAYPQAKEAALKSLALDSMSAAARTELGKVYEYYEWDFEAAEREFRTALVSEPRHSEARFHLGNMLRRRGALPAAMAEYRQAFEMDPINVQAALSIAFGFLWSGQLDSAEASLTEARELDPGYSGLAISFARLRLQQERWADAAAELETMPAKGTLGESLLIVCEARLGRTGAARKRLAALEAVRATRYVSADYIAQGYAALGDRDRAFVWLDRAYQERSGYLYAPDLLFPWDAAMRADPRFQALTARIASASRSP